MRFGVHELEPNKHHSNEQYLGFFPNGFGASVIRGTYTYGGDRGLFELGVIRGVPSDWHLTYDTPVTSDVVGFLTADEVRELLVRSEALPTAVEVPHV